MNKKDVNKKNVIIFLGTYFIALIVLFGLKIYFDERRSELDYLALMAKLKSVDSCESLLENNAYAVCCIRDGQIYDCTDREEFRSNEEIEIIVDSSQIPYIQDFPDFNYVCLGTDIHRKVQESEGLAISFPEECFIFHPESRFEIKGIIPSVDMCMSCRRAPEDPFGIFTLLRVNLYPDPAMDINIELKTEEGIIEKDHFPVLNLKARIFD
ncbi:MAG: hypothetical protein WC283_02905 [Candidatus Paceibacterota bacterium]|jgi:hypothetical protein